MLRVVFNKSYLLYLVCCLRFVVDDVVVNVCLKDEFIIYYMVLMFFQPLIEYITFQIELKNYNTIDKVILKNKLHVQF